MVPRECQFTEILPCPEHIYFQRFYDAPSMSIYRDVMMPLVGHFTEILGCPEYANLQRFFDALSMSIYRDFNMPRAGLATTCSKGLDQLPKNSSKIAPKLLIFPKGA